MLTCEIDIDASRDRALPPDDAYDRWAALVSIALLLLGLGVFWATGFGDRISSDAGVTLLLAQQVMDTQSLLPADWYYGNGDFWILGPHLFALPFVAISGVTPLALACGNALGLAFIFATAFALARSAGARWPTASLAACLTISLYSHFQREFVVVQLSYGLMSAKVMLLLCLAVGWLRAADSVPRLRAQTIIGFYVLLLCVWTAENPLRPLAYFVVPFGIVLAVRRSRANRATIALASATVLALAIGWLLRSWLLGRLLMVPGLESFHFVPVGEWPQHASLIFAGLRHVYGGNALGAAMFPWLEAFLAGMRAVIVPAVAFVVFVAGRRVSANEFRRVPAATGFLSLAIIASLLTIGSTMIDPVSDRYLLPAWQLALVGLVVAARSLARWRWIATLFVVAFVFGGVLNAFGIQRAGSSADAAGLPHPPTLDGVIDALRKTGIRQGFATHRYANAAVVRSGGELELCDVDLRPLLKPARWINAAACFDPVRYAEGFFLVLAPDEKDAALATTLRATLAEPSAVIDVDGYSIWTYPAGSGNLGWLSR